MESNVTRVVILYGSQTGNAEDMSKRIGRHAKSLGYDVMVESMDDFHLPKLTREKLIIFVCSTTGHGQEPENMRNFYNFIRRRDLPEGCLTNLNFAVYGLGDSSYVKFNYVSKVLYKRLLNCGAKPVHDLVKGDEQHELGCDGVIYPSLEFFWTQINQLNKDLFKLIIQQPPLESSYELIVKNNLVQPNSTNFPFKQSYTSSYDIKTATCILNKRLTSQTHFQDTRHLSFKTCDDIEYEPGDVCAILPRNSLENVQQFIQLLNLNPDDRISLKKRHPDYMINYLYDFIPDGIRLSDLVEYYLDIQSVPKRSFFEYVWQFSDNELERDKLREFATTEGQHEMYEYCIQPKRSILEVLVDFPHTRKNIKLEYILDMIPPIKPRFFSIASSNKLHPNEIHLIVGVVSYRTRLRKLRLGLCSNYLSKVVPVDQTTDILNQSRSEIKFFIKRTPFKLPILSETPIVMIGPGLGIAPFRSFIEELSTKLSEEQSISIDRFLYFGCRFSNMDYYFKEELIKYSDNGLIKLRSAFSREAEKHRVQDLILQDGDKFRDLILNKNATVYVAGNSKLPEDLRSLFTKLLTPQNDNSSIESSQLVSNLEVQNRIQYDCW